MGKAAVEATRRSIRSQRRIRALVRLRAIVSEYKDKPCTDCGRKYPHYVTEFDHCRGPKLFNIGRGTSVSISKLRAEIAKCDLVCANCHKVRTHKRRQLTN